jgi:hypothetical protein
MPITFPNPSRSYDASIGAVRFWGYDRAMEASFFVTVAALQSIGEINKKLGRLIELIEKSAANGDKP